MDIYELTGGEIDRAISVWKITSLCGREIILEDVYKTLGYDSTHPMGRKIVAYLEQIKVLIRKKKIGNAFIIDIDKERLRQVYKHSIYWDMIKKYLRELCGYPLGVAY